MKRVNKGVIEWLKGGGSDGKVCVSNNISLLGCGL